VPLHYRD